MENGTVSKKDLSRFSFFYEKIPLPDRISSTTATINMPYMIFPKFPIFPPVTGLNI